MSRSVASAETLRRLHGPSFIDDFHSAESERRGWVPERLELTLELGRQPHVVVVEEADQRAAGEPRSPVSRGRHPGPFLSLVSDLIAELAHHIGSRIGRAVVDHEALDRRTRLSQSATDRLGHIRRAVVDRNHRADRTGRHACQ